MGRFWPHQTGTRKPFRTSVARIVLLSLVAQCLSVNVFAAKQQDLGAISGPVVSAVAIPVSSIRFKPESESFKRLESVWKGERKKAFTELSSTLRPSSTSEINYLLDLVTMYANPQNERSKTSQIITIVQYGAMGEFVLTGLTFFGAYVYMKATGNGSLGPDEVAILAGFQLVSGAVFGISTAVGSLYDIRGIRAKTIVTEIASLLVQIHQNGLKSGETHSILDPAIYRKLKVIMIENKSHLPAKVIAQLSELLLPEERKELLEHWADEAIVQLEQSLEGKGAAEFNKELLATAERLVGEIESFGVVTATIIGGLKRIAEGQTSRAPFTEFEQKIQLRALEALAKLFEFHSGDTEILDALDSIASGQTTTALRAKEITSSENVRQEFQTPSTSREVFEISAENESTASDAEESAVETADSCKKILGKNKI